MVWPRFGFTHRMFRDILIFPVIMYDKLKKNTVIKGIIERSMRLKRY